MENLALLLLIPWKKQKKDLRQMEMRFTTKVSEFLLLNPESQEKVMARAAESVSNASKKVTFQDNVPMLMPQTTVDLLRGTTIICQEITDQMEADWLAMA